MQRPVEIFKRGRQLLRILVAMQNATLLIDDKYKLELFFPADDRLQPVSHPSLGRSGFGKGKR